ncbi:uncharacterized protein N7484_008718 [Penicillium longicatenatum]|uniref:uncharacterized protein n=1 Tax=Penicillium longicatenatum TaxID=1561947 RepID=UPI002546B21A|nr:uncharacterized protein N7484_008718 [Penicillium longicatenatum]KAJ5635405.1 hypothetical protein N7484_008718 [Penicillium longicatenatum]
MENDVTDTEGIQNTRSPLLEVPNEILQHIAILLPSDWDIIKLALTCKEIKDRILGPDCSNASFWGTRFQQIYDMPQGRSSREVMMEYQTRSIVLQPIDFRRYNYDQQQLWLQVIKTMLKEVLNLPLPVGATSKTYEQLREAVRSSKFLSRPNTKHKIKGISAYYYRIQLCLSAFALDSTVSPAGFRDEYSIASVYSSHRYYPELEVPFIQHDRLDLIVLLGMRSFWARHLLSPTEGTFYDSFSNLAYDLKPKIRKTDGTKATDLSKSWIGYYSCLHPLPIPFHHEQRRQTCADLDSHWDQVDILSLEIESQTYESFWPAECEELVPRCGGPDIKRLYFHGYQNTRGASHDAANPMFGFVEPIENDDVDFPGWSRICFVICEKTEGNEQSTWSSGSPRWVHGYEAVIIPGGRFMLGRWIDMKNTSGRGPFIFWDV